MNITYEPTPEELQRARLTKEVSDALQWQQPCFSVPVPIQTEEVARNYLHKKVIKYATTLGMRGTTDVVVEKVIATAMNQLKGPGFTYANLYSDVRTFLTEPHVATALAFNKLHSIPNTPDEIDMAFGLSYELEECK